MPLVTVDGPGTSGISTRPRAMAFRFFVRARRTDTIPGIDRKCIGPPGLPMHQVFQPGLPAPAKDVSALRACDALRDVSGSRASGSKGLHGRLQAPSADTTLAGGDNHRQDATTKPKARRADTIPGIDRKCIGPPGLLTHQIFQPGLTSHNRQRR
jgi:hypothetical protein